MGKSMVSCTISLKPIHKANNMMFTSAMKCAPPFDGTASESSPPETRILANQQPELVSINVSNSIKHPYFDGVYHPLTEDLGMVDPIALTLQLKL